MSKKINMIGFTVNKLTVIDEAPSDSYGAKWKCLCECGNTIEVRGGKLRSKNPPKSCGCERTKKLIEYNKQHNIKDIANQHFGYITALEPTDKRSSINAVIWKCVCDCGKEIFVSGADLRSGKTKSCGCKKNKSFGENKIEMILKENNIDFIKEHSFDDLRFKDTNRKARFDFFVNNSYIIEYDGQQHSIQGSGYFDNETLFSKIQERDKIKNNYCFKNNIPIIRIPYYELDNIDLEMLQIETSKYLLREEY